MKQRSVLLIFTGGTISMGENPDTQALAPLNSSQVLSYIPELAKTGVHIKYDANAICRTDAQQPFAIQTKMDTNVAILKLFPGINEMTVKAILSIENLRVVVLESFGAGNAPSSEWFLSFVEARHRPRNCYCQYHAMSRR